MSSRNYSKKLTLSQPADYIIQVQGFLNDSWSISLNQAMITRDEKHDISILHLKAIDQAGLCGLLQRLNSLGLPLLRVDHIYDGELPWSPRGEMST